MIAKTEILEWHNSSVRMTPWATPGLKYHATRQADSKNYFCKYFINSIYSFSLFCFVFSCIWCSSVSVDVELVLPKKKILPPQIISGPVSNVTCYRSVTHWSPGHRVIVLVQMDVLFFSSSSCCTPYVAALSLSLSLRCLVVSALVSYDWQLSLLCPPTAPSGSGLITAASVVHGAEVQSSGHRSDLPCLGMSLPSQSYDSINLGVQKSTPTLEDFLTNS